MGYPRFHDWDFAHTVPVCKRAGCGKLMGGGSVLCQLAPKLAPAPAAPPTRPFGDLASDTEEAMQIVVELAMADPTDQIVIDALHEEACAWRRKHASTVTKGPAK